MSITMIINGPSKFDLMQALMVRKPVRPNVAFFIQGKIAGIVANIDSLEDEDGSGESWNISGYTGNNQKFTAYYRTEKRIGSFKTED